MGRGRRRRNRWTLSRCCLGHKPFAFCPFSVAEVLSVAVEGTIPARSDVAVVSLKLAPIASRPAAPQCPSSAGAPRAASSRDVAPGAASSVGRRRVGVALTAAAALVCAGLCRAESPLEVRRPVALAGTGFCSRLGGKEERGRLLVGGSGQGWGAAAVAVVQGRCKGHGDRAEGGGRATSDPRREPGNAAVVADNTAAASLRQRLTRPPCRNIALFSKGLSRSGTEFGPLTDLPDWSYAGAAPSKLLVWMQTATPLRLCTAS